MTRTEKAIRLAAVILLWAIAIGAVVLVLWIMSYSGMLLYCKVLQVSGHARTLLCPMYTYP